MRHRALGLAAALVALALAGGAGAQAPQAGQPAAKRLVLAMAVTPPNLVHISPYLAKDLGYFKEEGLDVEIISFEGGVGTLRAVLAERADLSWTSSDPPIVARTRGAAIRLIYSSAPRLEAVLTVQGDIKTLKDLKGRKLGIQEPNGFADIFSRRALLLAGLKPTDAQFISTSTAGRVPALITGQVDTGVLHVEQAIRAIKRKPTLHNLINFWEAFPDSLYSVIVVHEKKLKEDPAAVTAFVRAVIKSNRFIYQNKEKTLDAAVEFTGYSREELEPAYDQLVKGRVWSVNDGIPKRMVEASIENQVRVGNIPADKRPKYEDLVDLGPVTEALKSLGRWTDDPNYL
ncbi:MAG TPA: ABC transporter substrate-binding protein [Thermodesulfobacteriota bacterium]|nr:ABC transporter substrate-binding protein [Thermodesulfobacteriota bacterium]